MKRFLLLGLLLLPLHARAASTVSQTLSIVVQGSFVLVVNPSSVTLACAAAPGTVVASMTTSGGDGNAITFTLTGNNTTDFVISGKNVVVAPAGIAPANCGKTFADTLTASQP